jgi:hypothetical protein
MLRTVQDICLLPRLIGTVFHKFVLVNMLCHLQQGKPMPLRAPQQVDTDRNPALQIWYTSTMYESM